MSSTPIDIVKVFYGTFSLMGASKAGLYLAADFQSFGFTPAPIDRETWIQFLTALKRAVPDMKIRLTNVRAEGDQVWFTEMGLGTHRLPMDLSAFDLPEIPADGAPVTFPSSDWVLTVDGSKIARAELVNPSPETGLPGMLHAFNVQPALVG